MNGKTWTVIVYKNDQVLQTLPKQGYLSERKAKATVDTLQQLFYVAGFKNMTVEAYPF